MKPFLVDVPVKINIWIRPECQKKQFDVIRKARPSILFIQSDGGRNEKEWKAILENRKMIDSGIDWDCTVYRFYSDVNQGLYEMGTYVRTQVWDKVDRCIFLEDDDIPAVSFFRFCAELLEKYKNDERIECICGFNHLEKYNGPQSDYFFSRQGSIWGFATWKRVEDSRYTFDYINDSYIMNLLKERTKDNPVNWKLINKFGKEKKHKGMSIGDEFWIRFDIFSQNMLQIVPTKNMISYVGGTSNSEHFNDIKLIPSGLRKIFNTKVYELNFPIRHPQYVIPDINYERKRNKIMGYNAPFVNKYRKIESLILSVRYLGLVRTGKRILKKVKKG